MNHNQPTTPQQQYQCLEVAAIETNDLIITLTLELENPDLTPDQFLHLLCQEQRAREQLEQVHQEQQGMEDAYPTEQQVWDICQSVDAWLQQVQAMAQPDSCSGLITRINTLVDNGQAFTHQYYRLSNLLTTMLMQQAERDAANRAEADHRRCVYACVITGMHGIAEIAAVAHQQEVWSDRFPLVEERERKEQADFSLSHILAYVIMFMAIPFLHLAACLDTDLAERVINGLFPVTAPSRKFIEVTCVEGGFPGFESTAIYGEQDTLPDPIYPMYRTLFDDPGFTGLELTLGADQWIVRPL